MAGSSALASIEGRIGYTFDDPSHLVTALTHTSYAGEHPGTESYERYEFLGDSVLGLAITLLIFDAMPDEPEGTMTRVRAQLVDEQTLVTVARAWGLGQGLRLGVGEDRAGGRDRDSILADAAEAVVAAIALDGGADRALAVVRSSWAPMLTDRLEAEDHRDARSRLQEILASKGVTIEYTYERSGPDHAAVFTATAVVGGEPIGRGTGPSKKAAAIAAAAHALDEGLADEITTL